MQVRYLIGNIVLLGGCLSGETLEINQESIGRLRIVVENNATEDILVSIHHVRMNPLPKNLVRIGEWRHFFPQQLTSPKAPLHITIRGSSTGTLDYTLALRGNGGARSGAIAACRAYGSLELLRGEIVLQSIGASALDSGIVLRFEEGFELFVEPLKWRDHHRKTGKEKINKTGCTSGSPAVNKKTCTTCA